MQHFWRSPFFAHASLHCTPHRFCTASNSEFSGFRRTLKNNAVTCLDCTTYCRLIAIIGCFHIHFYEIKQICLFLHSKTRKPFYSEQMSKPRIFWVSNLIGSSWQWLCHEFEGVSSAIDFLFAVLAGVLLCVFAEERPFKFASYAWFGDETEGHFRQ